VNERVSASRDIAAPADAIWALVTDLPRMGEWSSENLGGKWLKGAVGPAPGATFRGANRNGIYWWKTKAIVQECIPGERFSFRVTSLGIPVSEWTYEFEATEAGCRVTESWVDRRPGFFKPISSMATGVRDRETHTRAELAQTLDSLAAAAEAQAG